MKMKTKITLLYGCRTESDAAFKQELETMQLQNSSLKVVFVLSEPDANWKGRKGIIGSDLVKEEIPDYKERIFYTCGPPPMVEGMEKLIESLGLHKTQLRREYFTGYTVGHS